MHTWAGKTCHVSRTPFNHCKVGGVKGSSWIWNANSFSLFGIWNNPPRASFQVRVSWFQWSSLTWCVAYLSTRHQGDTYNWFLICRLLREVNLMVFLNQSSHIPSAQSWKDFSSGMYVGCFIIFSFLTWKESTEAQIDCLRGIRKELCSHSRWAKKKKEKRNLPIRKIDPSAHQPICCKHICHFLQYHSHWFDSAKDSVCIRTH